ACAARGVSSAATAKTAAAARARMAIVAVIIQPNPPQHRVRTTAPLTWERRGRALVVRHFIGSSGSLIACILRPRAERPSGLLLHVSAIDCRRRLALLDPVHNGREHVEALETSQLAMRHSWDAVET